MLSNMLLNLAVIPLFSSNRSAGTTALIPRSDDTAVANVLQFPPPPPSRRRPPRPAGYKPDVPLTEQPKRVGLTKLELTLMPSTRAEFEPIADYGSYITFRSEPIKVCDQDESSSDESSDDDWSDDSSDGWSDFWSSNESDDEESDDDEDGVDAFDWEITEMIPGLTEEAWLFWMNNPLLVRKMLQEYPDHPNADAISQVQCAQDSEHEDEEYSDEDYSKATELFTTGAHPDVGRFPCGKGRCSMEFGSGDELNDHQSRCFLYKTSQMHRPGKLARPAKHLRQSKYRQLRHRLQLSKSRRVSMCL